MEFAAFSYLLLWGGKAGEQLLAERRRESMRSKVVVGLMVALAVLFFISSVVVAQQKAGGAKLLCVSKSELKGEETVSSCLAKGERFAVVDQFGLVRILTPEEVELTKAFNPKAFESRAFGMRYQKEAPMIAPLPVPKEAGGG
jgi:hypothetical protein